VSEGDCTHSTNTVQIALLITPYSLLKQRRYNEVSLIIINLDLELLLL
jgi:hypothetical protein